jgi:hypothetical protein
MCFCEQGVLILVSQELKASHSSALLSFTLSV